jgi:hypothetical protein
MTCTEPLSRYRIAPPGGKEKSRARPDAARRFGRFRAIRLPAGPAGGRAARVSRCSLQAARGITRTRGSMWEMAPERQRRVTQLAPLQSIAIGLS